MSVVQPNLQSPNPFSYPRKVQNPDTGERVNIQDENELWKLIESWTENYYLYSTLVAHPAELIDADSQNLISKYHYCKELNTNPFPGSYEDHPAEWVDAVDIIKSETSKALEYLRKKNG